MKKPDTLTTMPPKRDEEGLYLTGYAIAFRQASILDDEVTEGVLVAGSMKALKAMHASLLMFDADWKKARRVQVRKIEQAAAKTPPKEAP